MTKKSAQDWVRLAAKLSLLFTEPKVRNAIADHFKGSVDDISDTVNRKAEDIRDRVTQKYESAVDRLDAAADALHGETHWPSRVAGFLLGVGVGAGLGILLAPASGAETRDSVRDTVVDAKNRVFDSAAYATDRIRQSVTSMPSTGTEG
jgi:gas vesicle protein